MAFFNRLICLISDAVKFFSIGRVLVQDLVKAFFLQCLDFVTATKKNMADEVVVITGGAGGIGSALGKKMAALGAKVVLLDLNEQALERHVKTLKTSGWSAWSYPCDCSDLSAVRKVAKSIFKHPHLGHVDMLINCTGLLIPKSVITLSSSEIRKSFDANVFSIFWAIKAFLPSMLRRDKGHIVSVCSIAGHFGQSFASAYSSSKFAVRGLMESVHWEILDSKKSGVKTTTLYPYFTQTNLLHSCSPSSRFFENLPVDYTVTKLIDYILYEREEAFIPFYASTFGILIKALTPSYLLAVWRKFFKIVYFTDSDQTFQLLPADEESSDEWEVPWENPQKPKVAAGGGARVGGKVAIPADRSLKGKALIVESANEKLTENGHSKAGGEQHSPEIFTSGFDLGSKEGLVTENGFQAPKSNVESAEVL